MYPIEPLLVASDLSPAEPSVVAADATWEVPWPLVLVLYVVVAVVAIGTGIVIRLRVGVGSGPPRDEELTIPEVGMLSDPRQAVMAAVALLRTHGLVGSAGTAVRAPTPQEHNRLDPFTLTIFARLGTSRWTIESLTSQSGWPVYHLYQHMVRLGYLLPVDFGARMRNGGLPIALVGALGIVLVPVGASGGEPVEPLVCVLLFVPAFWQAVTRFGPTSLGRDARQRIENRYQYLDPKHSPAYEAYGSMAAAMAVAVFGAEALAGVDPGLAKAVEANQRSGRSGAGGFGAGGCGGGGGGCGGGGG